MRRNRNIALLRASVLMMLIATMSTWGCYRTSDITDEEESADTKGSGSGSGVPPEDSDSEERIDGNDALDTGSDLSTEFLPDIYCDYTTPWNCQSHCGEECCNDPGPNEECWWVSAEDDGVTCSVDDMSNCAEEQSCLGGLCTCRDSSDCNRGICTVNQLDQRVCGPSYCNGFQRCSCFGGCTDIFEWDGDGFSTPEELARFLSKYCCEGMYPCGMYLPWGVFSDTPDCISE